MPNIWCPGYDVQAEPYTEKEDYDIMKPPTADVQLRVPWSVRYSVMQYILSNMLQWPYNSTVPLYAVSGGISPKSQSRTEATLLDGGNAYDLAILNIHFDPFQEFTEKISPHGEMIKVPKIGVPQSIDVGGDGPSDFQDLTPVICWDETDEEEEDPLTVFGVINDEESPTKLIIGHDYSVSYKQLDSLPPEMLTLIDHVNDSPCTGVNLELTFEAETILLSSAEASHTVAVDGSVTNTLDMHFSWRQNGWNKFWRKDTQTWDYLYLVWTDKRPENLDSSQIVRPVTGGPEPEIYRNFPLGDFSALLPS